MSLFPARQSQQAFLSFYHTLPDDDEDKGEDLQEHVGDYDDDDGPVNPQEAAELQAMVDQTVNDEDDSTHRALDASTRAAEERAIEAMAARFEAKARAHAVTGSRGVFDDDGCYEEQQATLARRKAARKVAAEAEAAEAAAHDALAVKEAARIKARRDAMAALYAFEEEDAEEAIHGKEAQPTILLPPAMPIAPKRTEPTAKAYRIKKRLKVTA